MFVKNFKKNNPKLILLFVNLRQALLKIARTWTTIFASLYIMRKVSNIKIMLDFAS
jgi:hypothetical protein